jgi:glycosyltransferase involved in cell wall biosynthesis
LSRIHVLMCTHNGGPYIAEQLESIFSQRLIPDHIHIHDFASRDDTVAQALAVAAAAPAKLELTRHGDAPGASLSFFRALRALQERLAEDDIVLLADQDDVWLSDKTVAVREALDSGGARTLLVFHDVRVVDSALAELRPTYYTGNPFAVPRDLDPTRLLLSNPVIGHTMALRAPLLRAVLPHLREDRYLMHDWALLLFASRLGEVQPIDRVLSLYRQHDRNVLGAYGRRRLTQTLRRVWRFADAASQQAIAFSQDVAACGPGVEPSVEASLRRGSSSAAYARLAWEALRTGPTIQRKGLAMFIAAQGLNRAMGGR